MVMPCDRNSDSSFQNSRRDTGSTPVVGSSSRISAGSCTSVQASASFCFMPPDSRRRAAAKRRELRHLEQPVAPRAVVADAVDLGEERDVLVDAEIAVEAEPLRQVADRAGDPAVVAHRIEVRARGRVPLSARQQAADQPDRRRLAGAVRADQPEHLAALDRQRELADGRGLAVPLGDAIERDESAWHLRHWNGISASTGMPAFSMPPVLSTETLTR